jgi:hypothetical protein
MHAGMMNVVKVRPMDEGRSASGAAPPSAHSAGGGGGVH